MRKFMLKHPKRQKSEFRIGFLHLPTVDGIIQATFFGKYKSDRNWCDPRKVPSTSFWKDFLKNLISDPRSRSETQIVHTNSARRDCWKRSRSPLDMYLSKSVTFEIGQISCYLLSKHTFLPSQNRSIEQGSQTFFAYFDLRIKILG